MTYYKIAYSHKGNEDVQLKAFSRFFGDETVEDVKKIFEKRGCIVRSCEPAEELDDRIWNDETTLEAEGLFLIDPFTDDGKSLHRMTPEQVCRKLQNDPDAECYNFGDQQGFSYYICFGDDTYQEDVSNKDIADALGYELDEDGDFDEDLGAGDIASEFEDLGLERPRYYELCLQLACDACIGQAEHLFGWPAKISIDGGKTNCTISQALAACSLEQLKENMDWDIEKYVQEELPDDCTDAQFLMRYLELSPVDLIIG